MIQREIESQQIKGRAAAGELLSVPVNGGVGSVTPARSPLQLINDQVEEEKEQLNQMVDSSVEGASNS